MILRAAVQGGQADVMHACNAAWSDEVGRAAGLLSLASVAIAGGCMPVHQDRVYKGIPKSIQVFYSD